MLMEKCYSCKKEINYGDDDDDESGKCDSCLKLFCEKCLMSIYYNDYCIPCGELNLIKYPEEADKVYRYEEEIKE